MPAESPVVHRHHWRLARRMVRNGLALFPLAGATLLSGMAIYHWAEGLPWSGAFLNAAMLLGGMGPVDALHTEAGRWLAGLYALFAGIVFLVVAGVMLSPVIHHALDRWGAGSGERRGGGKGA
jgi:hypothetical protein